ncbi:MAG: ABC transporter permease [Bacteroidales bacterium]|nr:ABC transporter permease [Bacteroidales bacterium]
MKLKPFIIALKSLSFHLRDSLYQAAIVTVLTAIICGSLLTGHSVRVSLRRNLEEKTGSADLLISSGLRYFNASLAGNLTGKSSLRAAALTETGGYCTNYNNGETALDIKIYGVESSFFTFHGLQISGLDKGSVLVNENLARKINLNQGDEIILGFSGIDPLPSNAPFAPGENDKGSGVFRITGIIRGSEGGNFSLGSSQSQPYNVFINPADLETDGALHARANRILVEDDVHSTGSQVNDYLKQILIPEDIGLSVRVSERTGEAELISDRIFIDSAIVRAVTDIVPGSAPVMTYLANSFDINGKSTPYSFISALSEAMPDDIEDDEIIISSWLAEDLDAGPGDTLRLTWFDPGGGKSLKESGAAFRIRQVAGADFRYLDPSLMPEFPGISGSTTCSSWDAGVPLDMKRIRKKDEDYWTDYKGTPKAFISYRSGLKLWGNNFGPATAIRFSTGDQETIIEKLAGNIDPSVAGFSVTDLRVRNKNAYSRGVDFGMLFIGLSFFILLSCVVLLSMALKLFLDSRKGEIRTYYSIGFNNAKIKRLLIYETLLTAIAGAIAGSVLGYLVNYLIVNALNSVWIGAVQTDTLAPAFSVLPVASAFSAAVIIAILVVLIRLRYFLKDLSHGSREIFRNAPAWLSLKILPLVFLPALALLLLSALFRDSSTALAFSGGILLFAGMLPAAYLSFAARSKKPGNQSGIYYSRYPLKAITPIIFLAAGIFAVVITGANRQVITGKMLLRSGGTGGFLLWAETALPVGQDLNSNRGKAEFGLEVEDLKDITFVQARKLSGDDASCLNIAYVAAPPVLGIDPATIAERGSFSFATSLRNAKATNPWSLLNENPDENVIYGIADQTVLQWGLKKKTGDTLKYVSENGQLLNIVICGGLKSSVFQGHLLIGKQAFEKHFPSVEGNSVFLVDGNRDMADLYRETLTDRFAGYGISVEPAYEKLASFFSVTNTYLEVFMMMGIFGMILGVAGLGFMLLRNFNSRKREFAFMIASGYTVKRIRKLLLRDHILILLWGVLTGTVSAAASTWPSVAGGSSISWGMFIAMLFLISLTGYIVLHVSVNSIDRKDLISRLRAD